MEGVLIVIKAWALMGVGLWFYRRFFERVARAEPEFEAWCKQAQVVAAIRADPATLKCVEHSLRQLLGERMRIVATLGGWPWTNYALQVRVSRVEGALALFTERAELMRTHGSPPPGLIAMLRALQVRHPEVAELWLCPGAVYKQGSNEAPQGWLLEPNLEAKPRLNASPCSPSWLRRPEQPLPEAPEAAPGLSSKFLEFRAEC